MTDPAQVISVTLAGRTFRACRHCAAHVEWTIERLDRRQPDATLQIIQPPWNAGVDASAGTHDKCAAFDFAILGMEWFPAQRFLRESGFAAWYRFPPTFTHHIHALSLGCPSVWGEFVPGQFIDYHNHAFGLAGQHDPGSDKSWFPDDIDATQFDYQRWVDRVTPEDMDKINAAIKASEDRTVQKVLAAIVGGDTTVKKALRLSAEAAQITKKGNA